MYPVIISLLLILIAAIVIYHRGEMTSAGIRIRQLEAQLKSHHIEEVHFVQQPRTQPACQFCGNKLTKVARSKEGFWCCASCAILELNQLPNQEHLDQLLSDRTKH
jgi:hypothetical protein